MKISLLARSFACTWTLLPLAQGQTPALPNGAQSERKIESAHAPAQHTGGSVVTLDWDSDMRRDLAQIVGGEVFVASGVDSHRTFVPMHAESISGYLGLGQLPHGPDQLLTTHATQGLQSWSWNGQTGVFSATDLSSTWTDVLSLISADLDGDGDMDIAGRRSQSVVSMLAQNDGSFQPGPSVTLSGEVLDIDAIDWDGDGSKEVAILTSGNLRVWNANQPVFVHVEASPMGDYAHATHIWRSDGDKAALALLTEVPGLSQFLYVTSPLGAEAVQAIGNVDIRSMAGGDSDGDGDDDLLLVSAASPIVYGLHNTNAPGLPTNSLTYVITPTTVTTVSYSSSLGPQDSQDATLIHEDLDRDGDADFALFRTEEPALVVQRNGLTWENDHRVDVPHFWFIGPEGDEEFSIDIPINSWPFYPLAQSPANPGADAWIDNPSEFEVTIWRMDAEGRLDPIPVFWEFVSEDPVSTVVHATVPESSALFENDYALLVRRVRRSPAGTLTETGPDSYFTLFDESDQEIESTGGSNPGPGAPPVATECRRPPCNSGC